MWIFGFKKQFPFPRFPRNLNFHQTKLMVKIFKCRNYTALDTVKEGEQVEAFLDLGKV